MTSCASASFLSSHTMRQSSVLSSHTRTIGGELSRRDDVKDLLDDVPALHRVGNRRDHQLSRTAFWFFDSLYVPRSRSEPWPGLVDRLELRLGAEELSAGRESQVP